MRDNPVMRFGVLGAVEVRRSDESELTVGGPRVRALLALLLLNAGQVVSVDQLVDGLYGDNPPGDANNALQSQVSRLRRGLADAGGLVELTPAGYRLAVDPDTVDVHRFDRLARAGQRALAVGDATRSAALLTDAMALWRGPALADVLDAPFAAAQVTRLGELRLAVVEDLTEARLALGEHRDVVVELAELVAEHPLRERLRAQLMRALYGAGRQAEALTVYEDGRTLLADELGADPGPDLAKAHLAVLRADPALTPAERPVPAAPTRTGLPAALTSFVGRADDLDRIGRLLGSARLVTLTGPGGAGKTRVAIEAGQRESCDVCFVELAKVGTGAGVPQALLDALGIREATLRGVSEGDPNALDPVARLVAGLADQRLLLVLDNCEQVVAEVAGLVHRLLRACPGLRVLATSQEALGITGETLYPLAPLPLPPAGSELAEATGYAAVALFADRAAAVRPGFTVDADTLAAVLRICTALDGLPLAIELAAARLRSLTVAEVAARLDDRFRLLSRGSRTAAPRHQTLRAVVEWSWSLLDPAEQELARRLTVFAGGATATAIAAVCETDDVDTELADLTDKSLVEVCDGRYRMLETIRAFGAQQLVAAEDADRVRRAHAEYFRELAETAEPFLRTADQLVWLERLATEQANLEAALRWAIDSGESASALRLYANISSYWRLRGMRTGGSGLAVEILSTMDGAPTEELAEEYVLTVLGASAGHPDDPNLRRHLDAAERFMNTVDRSLHYPFLLIAWALHSGPPDYDNPPPLWRHLAISDDPWVRGLNHFGEGFRLWQVERRLAEGEAAMTAALADFRAIGDRLGIVQVLNELVGLADLRGDTERATELTNEALGYAEQLGVLEETADLLAQRGDRLVRAGELALARVDYQRAAECARRAGAPDKLARTEYGLAEVARRAGEPARARELAELALAQVRGDWYGVVVWRSRVLITLGRLAEADGDLAAARARYEQAKADAGADLSLRSAAILAVAQAGLALSVGDGDRAALLLGAAKVLRSRVDDGDPDTAGVTAAVLAVTGPAGFESAFAKGAALTTADALAEVTAPARV